MGRLTIAVSGKPSTGRIGDGRRLNSKGHKCQKVEGRTRIGKRSVGEIIKGLAHAEG